MGREGAEGCACEHVHARALSAEKTICRPVLFSNTLVCILVALVKASRWEAYQQPQFMPFQLISSLHTSDFCSLSVNSPGKQKPA